jgi:putative transposase
VQFYVLFFIHIGTRKVHIAGMTPNPDNAWMVQQARNLAMTFDEEKIMPKYLVLDNDSKFTAGFDSILKSEGVELIRTPVRSPNMNPFAERWVLSIKSECLDHFVVFGEAHLRHIIKEFVAHYNKEQPHQGLDNVPLPEAAGESSTLLFPSDRIECEERLGGLLKHYRRAA